MIRRAIPGDIVYIHRMMEQAAGVGELELKEQTVVRRNRDQYWVTVANGVVTGMARFMPYSPRLGEILSFFVPANHQKKGYEPLLLRACQEDAVRLRIARVLIVTKEKKLVKRVDFRLATPTERLPFFWTPREFSFQADSHLRAAVKEDIIAIWALIEKAADHRLLRPRSILSVEQHLGEAVVAVNGLGEVVGTAFLEVYAPETELQPDLAEIRSLVVASEESSKGFGHALVNALKDRALKRGVKELMAVTSRDKFFRSLDFRRTTQGEAYFWEPEPNSLSVRA
ncbi:MAG: GNAT family N-acetyltransferase [Patescibacteria group bacterium]